MALQHFYSGKIKSKFKSKEQISIHCSVNLFINFTEKPKANPQPPRFLGRPFSRLRLVLQEDFLPQPSVWDFFLASIQQLPNLPISPRLGHHTFQGNIALDFVDVGICR